MTWQERAACAGIDNATRDRYFYPKRSGGKTPRETVEQHDRRFDAGKALFCARCPVTRQCLQLAIETGDQVGLFGGLSPLDRRRLTVRGRLEDVA